uniref:ATP-dependent DNA helicase n=1 Tax=Strongyloides venezuelensis TaxID=75913 RepID=A0A0K0EUS0_STRVS
MFNTLGDLIEHLQANQVCNNSIFELNGVNISIKNISNDNSDISSTINNAKEEEYNSTSETPAEDLLTEWDCALFPPHKNRHWLARMSSQKQVVVEATP